MIIRKIVLSSVMGLLVCNAYAGESKAETKKVDIGEAKQRILVKIDEHIALLTDAKSCIRNAQTHQEIKKCRPKKERK